MVCADCHDPHGSRSRMRMLVRDSTNELCVSCHAEYRGPMLFDHAPVSEDCTLCHEPHGSVHRGPADAHGATALSVLSLAAGPSEPVVHGGLAARRQSVGHGAGAELRELPHAGAWLQSSLRLQPDALAYAEHSDSIRRADLPGLYGLSGLRSVHISSADLDAASAVRPGRAGVSIWGWVRRTWRTMRTGSATTRGSMRRARICSVI